MYIISYMRFSNLIRSVVFFERYVCRRLTFSHFLCVSQERPAATSPYGLPWMRLAIPISLQRMPTTSVMLPVKTTTERMTQPSKR